MRWCFGAVLGGLGEGSGGFLDNFGWIFKFGGLKKSQTLSPKLKTEKMVSGTRGGSRHMGLGALILVNDHSIVGIIDRRALES